MTDRQHTLSRRGARLLGCSAQHGEAVRRPARVLAGWEWSAGHREHCVLGRHSHRGHLCAAFTRSPTLWLSCASPVCATQPRGAACPHHACGTAARCARCLILACRTRVFAFRWPVWRADRAALPRADDIMPHGAWRAADGPAHVPLSELDLGPVSQGDKVQVR